MQRHALERAIAQNELVPYRHQCMKTGQIKNDGAGILVEVGDQSGGALHWGRNGWNGKAEE